MKPTALTEAIRGVKADKINVDECKKYPQEYIDGYNDAIWNIGLLLQSLLPKDRKDLEEALWELDEDKEYALIEVQ